jgi:hypothetical protein
MTNIPKQIENESQTSTVLTLLVEKNIDKTSLKINLLKCTISLLGSAHLILQERLLIKSLNKSKKMDYDVLGIKSNKPKHSILTNKNGSRMSFFIKLLVSVPAHMAKIIVMPALSIDFLDTIQHQ